VNVWMHGEFLVVDKGKMAKSAGNFLTLKTLTDQSYSPLHYRYLCFSSHYRSQLMFSYEALTAAKNAFESLKNRVISWKLNPQKGTHAQKAQAFQKQFEDAMANDLDTPVAMAVMWEAVKDNELSNTEKLNLLMNFDAIFGFGVADFSRPELSEELQQLVLEREAARAQKDFQKSDAIRDALLQQGVQIKDTPKGPDWYFVL